MAPKQVSAISELDELLVRYPQIEYVDAFISDLNNIVRGKRFPVKDAHKIYTSGVQFPESVFLLDTQGESDDPCGRGFSDGDPDGSLFPIPGMTQYVPWGRGNRAQVLTQLYTDSGKPCNVDPRVVLANVLAQFSSLGYQSKIAFELEFYLLDKEPNIDGQPQFPKLPNSEKRVCSTQVYSLEELNNQSEFLNAVDQACIVQQIPATVATSEYSPSQYEINLQHVNNPILAVDHCILLKKVIRGIAESLGMKATFMAKPFSDLSGSGTHIHLSMQNEQGVNIFQDESPLGSEILQFAIGGLLETMPDFFALFATTRNSFRRFVPDMYVPVNKTWGFNNRSVTVRIPSGPNEARRLEHRVAGADANPYLLLAAVLAGVHHGIANSVDPGPASNSVNVSNQIDLALPLKWGKAIEMFQRSELAKRYFTSDYVDLYCAVKREELIRFEQRITNWEYQLYL